MKPATPSAAACVPREGRSQPERRVIVTGDDFGLAVPVNEAIERAYRAGSLSTATLLVNGAASADAIARARRNPGLRVGLHLAVCEARPVLPASQLPGLVDAAGELGAPLLALLRWLLPRHRGALEAEIRAQFEAYARSGLTLDHVSGHNHMQLHPVVLPSLLRVAREYGAPPLRLPYEPLFLSLRAAGIWRLPFRLPWLVMWPWSRLVKWYVRRSGFACNDYLFGIYDCGHLHLERWLRIVAALPNGVSEIHCHPATRRCAEIDRTMPSYEHTAELDALLSPQLMAALAGSDLVQLHGFSELTLARPAGAARVCQGEQT